MKSRKVGTLYSVVATHLHLSSIFSNVDFIVKICEVNTPTGFLTNKFPHLGSRIFLQYRQ